MHLREILHKREVKPLIEREYTVTYLHPESGAIRKVKQLGFNMQDAKHRVAIEHQPKKVLSAL